MSSVNSIRITKEIEEAILSGQLKPRERLVEMDLISQFDVSRTVIREALKVEARAHPNRLQGCRGDLTRRD
jgi:DNA-binding GntR family transcriptional regulator